MIPSPRRYHLSRDLKGKRKGGSHAGVSGEKSILGRGDRVSKVKVCLACSEKSQGAKVAGLGKGMEW